MNATLTSTLVMKMIDGITGPSNRAAAALRALRQSADGVNSGGGRLEAAAGHLRRAAASHQKLLNELKAKFVVSAAATTAFAAALRIPIKAAADFETALTNIAQKADMTGERAAALGANLKKMAVDLRQSASSLATGIDTLVGMGLDPSSAETMIRPIAKAATAYQASIEDLSNASYAALQNLKIAPNEIAKALDIMAKAGKEGAFEIKDMAQYIPSLAAAYQALGQKGTPALADLAAALEVVRKGTGDSATAANDLENVLQKIQSPETRKRFQELGIDIRKALQQGAKEGRSPLEVLVEQTNKALKGDLSKLGDIFADKQVQEGLRALILNYQEYLRIREEAGKASGVVDKDFETRLTTMQAKIDAFTAAMQNLSITVGTALAPAIGALLDQLTRLATALDSVIQAHPQLASGALLAVGGLLALRTAVIGLRISMLALSIVPLTSLAKIAELGSVGVSGGLLATAGGIGAIAAALATLEQYEPSIMKWEELFRPKGKDGKPVGQLPPPSGGMPQMVGAGMFGRAGQIVNEWIRHTYANLPTKQEFDKSFYGATAGKGFDSPLLQPDSAFEKSRKEIVPKNVQSQVTVEGVDHAQGQLSSLKSSLDEVGAVQAAPGVVVTGVDAALAKLRELKNMIASINSSTVAPRVSSHVPAMADTGGGGQGW